MSDASARLELPILYRDAALLVVDKPSGLAVHRGWATDKVTALSIARSIAGQWVYPVHRLDRSTSGALVFALSAEIARLVQESFESELVHKNYVALVRGLLPDEVCIEHAIAKEKGKPKLPATTEVSCLEHYHIVDDVTGRGRTYSWIGARPLTGRPHQIRRHLKHISHPIIGDVRYGKAEHNRLFRRRFALERMALHAQCIELPHPMSGERLTVTAPIPDDLRQSLAALARAAATPAASDPSARAFAPGDS